MHYSEPVNCDYLWVKLFPDLVLNFTCFTMTSLDRYLIKTGFTICTCYRPIQHHAKSVLPKSFFARWTVLIDTPSPPSTSFNSAHNSGVEISSSCARASSITCRCSNVNFFGGGGLGKSAIVPNLLYFLISRHKLVFETLMSSFFKCECMCFNFQPH